MRLISVDELVKNAYWLTSDEEREKYREHLMSLSGLDVQPELPVSIGGFKVGEFKPDEWEEVGSGSWRRREL